jgi:hypothetical protein
MRKSAVLAFLTWQFFCQLVILKVMQLRYNLLLVVLAFSWLAGICQVTYTTEFTKLLEKEGIEYAEPTEQWLHVTIPPEHEYMRYDLVLQNDRNDYEVRYDIRHVRGRVPLIPPSVEVSRLLASIASNEDAHEILVKIPEASFIREAFNADQGILAYFRPKSEFSEKPYGALLTLYAGERQAIDVVFLFADPDYDPLTMYRSVRFADLAGK